MIGIWLELLEIQNPFFQTEFYIDRLKLSSHETYYSYFFLLETRLNPVYKISYSRRNFLYPYERFFLSDNLNDSIRSSIEFINGESKGISFYFERPVSLLNFNFNFMSLDEKNYSRFLLYYDNPNIFSGIKIVDKISFTFFSKYFGVSYNLNNRIIYGIFRNFMLSYVNDTIGLYSYFYIKKPIFIAHIYLNNKIDFFISPLFLLDVDKSIYFLISKELGLGFKSDFISFETGYNIKKKLPYFISDIEFDNFSIKLITNSDKDWIFQTHISKKFWYDRLEPKIMFTRTKYSNSFNLLMRIYGLNIYYILEIDTLKNLNNFWGARIKFFD